MTSAVSELLLLKFCGAYSDQLTIDDIHQVYDYLDLLLEQNPDYSPEVKAEILYQAATYTQYNNVDGAAEQTKQLLRYSTIFTEHTDALLMLADYEMLHAENTNDQTEKANAHRAADACLLRALNSKDTLAAETFYDLQIKPLTDEILTELKLAHINGNPNASIMVCRHYRETFLQADIVNDPVKVWWLQLAAQCGSGASLELLSTYRKNPYAACALGILHTYGILCSNSIAVDPEKAMRYFSVAFTNNALQIYLETGIREGVLCNDVKGLLETMTKAAAVHACELNVVMRKGNSFT